MGLITKFLRFCGWQIWTRADIEEELTGMTVINNTEPEDDTGSAMRQRWKNTARETTLARGKWDPIEQKYRPFYSWEEPSE